MQNVKSRLAWARELKFSHYVAFADTVTSRLAWARELKFYYFFFFDF